MIEAWMILVMMAMNLFTQKILSEKRLVLVSFVPKISWIGLTINSRELRGSRNGEFGSEAPLPSNLLARTRVF